MTRIILHLLSRLIYNMRETYKICKTYTHEFKIEGEVKSMDIKHLYSIISHYLISNQLIALGIVVGLTFFLWKKPKEFIKFSLFILAAIVVFYVFTLLDQSMDTGVGKKHEITTERGNRLSE